VPPDWALELTLDPAALFACAKSPSASSAVDFPTSYTYNVCMIRFEWSPAKSNSNLKKHGVSFEEAQSVFYDEYARQFFDDEHSGDEERFIMLGTSNRSRILVVCHCERASDDVIRIISARKATRIERKYYEGPLK